MNWYTHTNYIPNEEKTLEEAEAAYALREAWKRIYSEYPSDNSLAVLWAKSCLETGHWKHIHCYNFGNIKRKVNDNDSLFTMFECGEEVSLNEAQKLQKEDPERIKILKIYTWSNGQKRASINVKEGHLWSQFVAHRTVEDGAEAYIRFVSQRQRYAKAWQKVIEGDPRGYAHELKIAGYYTGSEVTYTTGVVKLFNTFLKRKNELMSWIPEVHNTIIPESKDTLPPPSEEDTLINITVPETVKENVNPEENNPIKLSFGNKNLPILIGVIAGLVGFISWVLQSCN